MPWYSEGKLLNRPANLDYLTARAAIITTSFLISGATGQIGTAILDYFRADPQQQIHKATHHKGTMTEKDRWLDFGQSDSFAAAIQAIDVVFLLRGPHLADVKTYFKPFIEACQMASVKQLVFLSVQRADDMAITPHTKIETLIRQSGIPYTFIRPANFMQNLTTTLKKDIVRHHRLFLPAGHAPFLWVDVSDIGLAIAVILANWRQHQNRVYTITGTELLTFKQVSLMLTAHLGYTINFVSPTLFRFYLTKRREGIASGLILIMILLHYLPRFQKPPQISLDGTHQTRRQPNTLA